MRQLAHSILGRLRLARGRCPVCASEGVPLVGCDTCKGYEGPFPASEATQRRWAWRFEQRKAAPLHPLASPHEIGFPGATHPLG